MIAITTRSSIRVKACAGRRWMPVRDMAEPYQSRIFPDELRGRDGGQDSLRAPWREAPKNLGGKAEVRPALAGGQLKVSGSQGSRPGLCSGSRSCARILAGIPTRLHARDAVPSKGVPDPGSDADGQRPGGAEPSRPDLEQPCSGTRPPRDPRSIRCVFQDAGRIGRRWPREP